MQSYKDRFRSKGFHKPESAHWATWFPLNQTRLTPHSSETLVGETLWHWFYGYPAEMLCFEPGKWSCLKQIQVFSCLVPAPHLPSTRNEADARNTSVNLPWWFLALPPASLSLCPHPGRSQHSGFSVPSTHRRANWGIPGCGCPQKWVPHSQGLIALSALLPPTPLTQPLSETGSRV